MKTLGLIIVLTVLSACTPYNTSDKSPCLIVATDDLKIKPDCTFELLSDALVV
ncbi:MAG: hypothetical protein QM488_01455 [Rhizobiaceae bacterium]